MRSVGIFHPDGNYFNNPSLRCMVEALLKGGWQVDIYGRSSAEFRLKVSEHPGLRLFTYDPFIPPGLLYGSYSLLIGVDEGIIDAAFMARSTGVSYGYISFEIYYDAEIATSAGKRNKSALRKACEDARFAVVQDSVRGKSLMREYGIPESKIMYVPVAGCGSIPYAPSYYLHDRLGIDREKSIILYMGSLGSWAATDMLAEQSAALPDKYVLVLHGRYGVPDEMRRRYHDYEKLFFSLEPAEDDDGLRRLVQSAFCCVALYVPTYRGVTDGRNLLEIGMASGKITTALQHGVPIMVNEIGQVAQIVRDESCGVVLDLESPAPLNAVTALEAVADIHANCRRAFEEHFDFARVRDSFLELLRACSVARDAVEGRHDGKEMEAYLRTYADRIELRPVVNVLLRVVRYCVMRLRDRYFR